MATMKLAGFADEAGIHIPEFGSLIGNWGKGISSDFEIICAEIGRAIPRMKRLGTPLIRNFPHPAHAELEGISAPSSRTS